MTDARFVEASATAARCAMGSMPKACGNVSVTAWQAEPFPYSVGIDPFAHRAVVAFASTNVGLVINLDKNAAVQCLPNTITPWQPPYCPIDFITLNTGTNPQVAFEPGARLTYVTPGAAGL